MKCPFSRILWIAVLQLCVSLTCACMSRTAPAGDPGQRVDALLTRYEDRGLFSGAALVAKHGKIVHEKGYGLADRERGIANSPDTPYQIASTSKLITRVAVLLEEEQGRLDTLDPLSECIPRW